MTTKRNCKCPNCSPTGGAILDAGLGDSEALFLQPVWTCRNCGHEMPRRILQTARRARIKATLNSLIGDPAESRLRAPQ